MDRNFGTLLLLLGVKCRLHAYCLDGNALIAWCGHPSTILEVNPKGEILFENRI